MINNTKNLSRMLPHIIALSLSLTVTACGTTSNTTYPMIDPSKKHTKNPPIHYDSKPSNVTGKDMDMIKNFDTLAYEITERKTQHINIAKIYNFIINNKSRIHDYGRLTISANGKLGTRPRRQLDTRSNYDFNNNREFYSAYVEVSYPLYDKKHQKTINNEKIKYNLEILKKVEDYASSMLDVTTHKEVLEFLRMKQRLIKAETKSGIKYRDDRIAILDKMITTKMKLRLAIEKRNTMRIYLLNLTSDPQSLRSML